MNTQDYYLEAVRAWQSANQNLKRFAECCYHVKDKDGLAEDCGVKLRTVQYYAAAWSLYQELLLEYPNATVALMWERGEISLWRKAPELRSQLQLSLAQTKDYLETAIDHHMTRESFSAHVDEKENDTPKWIRRLRSAIKFLSPSKGDYKSEMPPHVQERYNQAVAWFVNELDEIAEMEKA